MHTILSKIDIGKFNELETLCRIDPQLVIDNGTALIKKYTKKAAKDELASLYKCVGFSFCFVSKFEDAINYSSIALEGFLNTNDKSGVSDCYFNIGTIYFYAGNYSLALVNYKKALNISIDEKDNIRTANAYNGIGSVYYSVSQNKNALKFLTKALEIAEKELAEHKLPMIVIRNMPNGEKRSIPISEFTHDPYKELFG